MTTQQASNPIESRSDYQTPFSYWYDELRGAQQTLRRWHKQADATCARYLDERRTTQTTPMDGNRGRGAQFRLNLFHSNVYTQQALLYGQLPKVQVSRRYDDPQDDVSRLAAVILQRHLEADIEDDPESLNCVLKAALHDRLVPGLGVARVRYDATVAPSAPPDDDNVVQITSADIRDESVDIDYFHWRDILWGWSRSWADVPWMAFRNWLTRDEATRRYGKQAAENFTFHQQKMVADPQSTDSADVPENNEPWLRAEVWDIWDKQTRKRIEVHLDYPHVLKEREDNLHLKHFFPAPPFLVANATTALYRPTPDFHLAQDLYNEIDLIQTRISIITEACRVVGVYDKSTPEIQRMFSEGSENELIPVDNWAMFGEKGGLQGSIDWFPIEDVVAALVNLRQVRDETIALLYQVTGMSDILRGELQNQYEGVAQTQDKAMFASVRMQSLQEEFASFAANLLTLKAEIIARHFAPQTIIERSNAKALPDPPELIAEAVALIKQPDKAQFKVKIEADSMAVMDYRKLTQERTTYLQALSAFLKDATPMAQQIPETAPHLFRLMQWGLAAFRGGDDIEGAVDQLIQATEQALANPKPDPAQQQEQAKAQSQVQVLQAKAQAEMQRRAHDLQADLQTAQVQHQFDTQKTEAEFRQQAALIELKARADMATETHQSRVNAEQHALGVEAEMNKDIVDQRLDLDAEIEKTALEIRKTAAAEQAKRETARQTKKEPSDDAS